MPVLDAFTSGYIQETWSDIYIKIEEQEPGVYVVNIANPVGPEQVNYRAKPTVLDISSEYFPIEFIWIEQWKPILPKGYSALYTHPLNREDLAFSTLSGIVDSDVYHHEVSGALPFLFKKEFNGTVIPVGTPMYQLLPIKRETWESSTLEFNEDDMRVKNHSIRKYIFDGYRNNFWTKKTYT